MILSLPLLFSILLLFVAAGLLCILAVIDFRTRLLPDIYVFPFAMTGIAFHFITNFYFTDLNAAIAGFIAGAGFLLILRTIGNYVQKTDTLGLGDVKLMGTAGIWLGVTHIFLALTIGAIAGIIHGLVHAHILTRITGDKINLNALKIPAGPGFIFGIIVTAVLKFESLVHAFPP